MWSRVRKLTTQALGPMAFTGGLYLLLIPLYAAIYSFFPDDFYSSTAALDPRYRHTLVELEDDLNRYYDQCTTLNNTRVRVDVSSNDASIRLTTYLGGGAIFSIASLSGSERLGPGSWKSNPQGLMQTYWLDAEFRWNSNIRGPEETTSEQDADTKISNFQVGLRNCFNQFNKTIDTYSGPHQIPLETDLYLEFLRLTGSAQQGLHSGYAGQYGRFLYFSTVTITTLGYGDVLPVTDRMRWLVASQSIFGVVLIGLFLTAIGRQK